ncbi:transposase [Vreelandella glaciei]|uniref:transposase n=1 Tax=Vreelandella glaciei TaxID=186761 RepID=UPI0030EEB815|tara:strand:- start:642 stop:923 length:282 start_codon:yes stop_codon:yes gene_type:complete
MEKKEAQREATKQSLFEQFRLALERQFGASTEKYRVDQRDLLINEAEVTVDEKDDASENAAVADDATIDTATPDKSSHARRVCCATIRTPAGW